ncbi:calcium-binding protein [Jannaschia sp. M317]|uniref:calcium-binding protein n=1 Tax=Jannaschia sp. M317 TaxID=2867011 RepID=UPI0021A8BABA|nr:calcium-binding protein [Jannaschia sp. M317]UWQ19853.1 hypothetical protein K3551_19095 [Jannaschia sp. M317]
MAQIAFYQQTNMSAIGFTYGELHTATSSQIVVSAGPLTSSYFGNFSYSPTGTVSGVLTGYEGRVGGALQVSVREINIDATQVYAAIVSLDSNRFLNLALSGSDTLSGSNGSDLLFSLSGSDTISGGGGNDTLNGGLGPDYLFGGNGDDFILGGSGYSDLRDVIYGDDGNDSIHGGYGNDELHGGFGNDSVEGGFGSDWVIGNEGDDVLSGGALSDLIYGGFGSDFINGGFGFDRYNGGAGGDRFFHAGVAGHGTDWIQDYNASQADVLLFGIVTATGDDFQVNFAETRNAGASEVAEAFVIYKPTGQVMWALVDGALQEDILVQVNNDGVNMIYDLI